MNNEKLKAAGLDAEEIRTVRREQGPRITEAKIRRLRVQATSPYMRITTEERAALNAAANRLGAVLRARGQR